MLPNNPIKINKPRSYIVGISHPPNGNVKRPKFSALSNKKFRSVHLTYFLNSLIINGLKIKCLPYNGKWFEFDDEEELSSLIN